MDFKKTKTIIFDWDGTIHQSMAIYYEAFLKAYHYLENQGYAPQRHFTEYDVSQFLGMNPKEMWLSLLPELTDHIFHQASMIISESMKKSIALGHAKLYPQAEEVLTYLKEKGYQLIYLSNSKIYYMEAMKEAFKLERFFDQFHVSEMYDYIPKHEILTKFIETLDAPMIMIGDRSSDIETGRYNNIYTIGALYGYGNEKELEKADLKIQKISDLLQLF